MVIMLSALQCFITVIGNLKETKPAIYVFWLPSRREEESDKLLVSFTTLGGGGEGGESGFELS
jgi:hypothetical protein